MRDSKRTDLFLWQKILLLLVGSIVILTIALSLATWRSFTRAGRDIGHDGEEILSRQTEIFLEKFISGEVSTLDVQLARAQATAAYGATFLGETLPHYSTEKECLANLLPILLENTGGITTVYYVSLAGDLSVFPAPAPNLQLPRHFDPTGEPYFSKSAVFGNKVGEVYWSKAHINPLDVKYDLVVDGVAPVIVHGVKIGYLGASVSITQLIAQFNQRQPIRGGYSFLMDSDYQLVGAPPHARVDLAPPAAYAPRGVIDLRDTGSADLDAVLRNMALGQSSIEKVVIRGEAKYLAYHPLTNINWRLGLVVPVPMATAASRQLVDVVEGGTRRALLGMLFWAGCLLAVAVAVGVVIIRQLTLPLLEMAAISGSIADGRFDRRVDVTRHDEIGRLGIAFNSMADQVETMVVDLEDVNRQLGLKNKQLEEEITDRELAQRALKENEAKYRDLVQNANSIILRRHPEGRISFFNEFAQRFFGYSEEEILGANVVGTIVPETDTYGRDQAAVILDIGRHPERYGNHENENIRRNGQRVWVAWTNKAICDEDGKVVEILCIGNDITEHRRAEEERIRLTTAIEQAAESIIITDKHGTIQYINPAVERVSGFTRPEILGKNIGIFRGARHDEAFLEEIWDVVSGGDVWVGHIGNKMKDGTFREFEATISPVRDSSGKIVNFVSVNRDVTQEIALEAQLRQAQKMEAVGTLAGGIAHDFNNLLQGIHGCAELMLMRRPANDPDSRELHQILRVANRGSELIQQLLTFCRKVESRLVPTDLNQEVKQVEALLARVIPRMVEIELRLFDDLWIVNGDPAKIEQVLMNLAINARDAMPEGGKLTIETKNVTLDEAHSRAHLLPEPGNYVLLSISDTGHGMDRETLDHIFEPFYTTKESGKGTGLGLAMVYGVIQDHSGHVTCYSEISEGTTFKIYLPAIDKVIETQGSHAMEAPRYGSETVLLVDDEEIIRELSMELLATFGYTVLTASNGEEALDLYSAKKKEIDLIVLDLIMPGMGGRKCLEELLKMNPDVKVIIASGYSPNGPTREVMDAGAVGFLSKPYQAREILTAFREALGEPKSPPGKNT